MSGTVYLVGAGCGSADLITVRGRELLGRCDDVVYDDLIDPALLECAPQARRHPVGKRAGRASAPQSEINALLVRLGREGRTVVRLKGGDPFVFGRGGEEALALRGAGVYCEEVPGISSCIAIPAAAGIPVTHRAVSRSFHVVTGHTAGTGDTLPEDFEALAALRGTLVFLMGLGALEKIAARLIEAGKPAGTPAAVVSDGSAPHPAAVRGTLADIAARAREAGVQPPAVIVVGETAALDLRSAALPLGGVRVGVVGTPSFVRRAEERLRRFGARVSVPVAGRVRPVEPELSWPALAGRADWIVLTSANGVRRLFECLRAARADLRLFARCRFAAIGPATAAALEEHGIYPEVCAEPATSEGLARAMERAAKLGQTAALLRSADGGELLPAALRAQGLAVEQHTLYRVEFEPLQSGEADALVFGSAMGVRAYCTAHGVPRVGCVAVGPVTAGALREAGAECREAPEISAEGAARAVLELFGQKA